jgi:hypothetical protein
VVILPVASVLIRHPETIEKVFRKSTPETVRCVEQATGAGLSQRPMCLRVYQSLRGGPKPTFHGAGFEHRQYAGDDYRLFLPEYALDLLGCI